MHNRSTTYYTTLYCTTPTCFDVVLVIKVRSIGETFITNTALHYLRNSAFTAYELPEDDAVELKYVGTVQ
jgi:hypothetical protein